MKIRHAAAALFVVSAIVVLTVNGVPTGGGAPTPGHGGTYGPPAIPVGHVAYSNSMGVFDTNVSGSGVAVYNWFDGHGYKDTLTFVRQMALPDNFGNLQQANVYFASDGTNAWYLAFGTYPINVDGNGRNTFPVWYTFSLPTNASVFTRWLTPTGTNRVTINP